jgi:hypothetical protein
MIQPIKLICPGQQVIGPNNNFAVLGKRKTFISQPTT